jgi:hypothetical protein
MTRFVESCGQAIQLGCLAALAFSAMVLSLVALVTVIVFLGHWSGLR